jgi:hypothetical protein
VNVSLAVLIITESGLDALNPLKLEIVLESVLL